MYNLKIGSTFMTPIIKGYMYPERIHISIHGKTVSTVVFSKTIREFSEVKLPASSFCLRTYSVAQPN